MAVQVMPVRAALPISRTGRFRSTLNTREDTVHIYTLIPSQLTAQAAEQQVKAHVIKSLVMSNSFLGNIQTFQRPKI